MRRIVFTSGLIGEGWCVWHLYYYNPHMFFFLIVGYLKQEEVKEGHGSTSIKNVFCFETIKCLPAWLTPSSGESPLRL